MFREADGLHRWSNTTSNPQSLVVGFTPINQPTGCDAPPSREAADKIHATSRKGWPTSNGSNNKIQLCATPVTAKTPCRLQRSAGKRKSKDPDASRNLRRKKPVLSGNTLSNRILKYVDEDTSKDFDDLATESSSNTVLASTAKSKLVAFVYQDAPKNSLSDFAQGTDGTNPYDEHIGFVPTSAGDAFVRRTETRYSLMPGNGKSAEEINLRQPLPSLNTCEQYTGEERLLGLMPEKTTPKVLVSSIEQDFNEDDFPFEATPKGTDDDLVLHATDSVHAALLLTPKFKHTRSMAKVQMQQEAAVPSLNLTEGFYEADLFSKFSYHEDPTTRTPNYKESSLTFNDDGFSVTRFDSMEHFHIDDSHGVLNTPCQLEASRAESPYHDSDFGEMETKKICTDLAANKLPTGQADFPGSTERENPSASSHVHVDLTLGETTANKQSSIASNEHSSQTYSDDGSDSELLELITMLSNEGQVPSSSATSLAITFSPKLQWLPPKEYTPRKLAPSLRPKEAVNMSHTVTSDTHGEPLPFVRPLFPKSVRDRSPIIGLTSQTVLRTCFRIGEALNAAAIASRSSTEAIIELYARVLHSERQHGSVSQCFQFSDLFTADKPPYLSGSYDLWKSSDLWEHDSKAFLGLGGQGKIARVVGRIKRNRQGLGCKMTVLSIWEANWEDIGWVKGIVCA